MLFFVCLVLQASLPYKCSISKTAESVDSYSVWSDPRLRKALVFTGDRFSDPVFDNCGLFSVDESFQDFQLVHDR